MAVPLLLLTATYLLTLASVDPWDIGIGAAASLAVLGGLRAFFEPIRATSRPPVARRLALLPRFAWAVLREVVVGTWLVANVVLGRRELVRPGIVAVPVGERTELGLVVTALAINLSPGEVLVDVDREGGRMLVHVLEAEDPDAVRRRYDDFYRDYQQGIFP